MLKIGAVAERLCAHAGEIVGNEGAAGDVLKESEIQDHGMGRGRGDTPQYFFGREIAQIYDRQLAVPRLQLFTGAVFLVPVEFAHAGNHQHVTGFRQHIQCVLQGAGDVVAGAQKDQRVYGGIGKAA